MGGIEMIRQERKKEMRMMKRGGEERERRREQITKMSTLERKKDREA